jgi:DNA-binding transcriptional LysR family regulator
VDPHRLGLVSRRLHYFQMVARLGSIRQAAREANVAPSSISRVVAQLEDELEMPLFQRIHQRLKLTSAGELLLYHARVSLNELARACREISDLHGLRRGTVLIAVVESVARGLLPAVLSEFWERYPAIAVDIKVVGSQAAFDAVAAGECDIAMAFDARTPRSAQRLAASMLSMGVLMQPSHPLAGRTSLRLFDLSGERIIFSDASLTLGESIREAMGGSLVDLNPRARTNSIGIMIDLALRGSALALQTRMGVEREIADGTLVFVPVQDTKLRPHKLLLISRSKTDISDAAARLAMMLASGIEAIPG